MNRKKISVVIAVSVALTATVFAPTGSASADEGAPSDRVQQRIIGGSPAAAANWPSIAAIYSLGASNPVVFNGQFCGGTLIAPKWVLTAAHCVEDAVPPCSANPCLPGDLGVMLGDRTLTESQSSPPTRELKQVTRVISYPTYDAVAKDHDLALLELSTASTRPLRRIVTPSQASYWEAGDPAFVAGWGDRDPSDDWVDYPATMEEVGVDIVNDALCEFRYDELFTLTSEVCAGDIAAGGRDSCQGDSGGPLEVDTPSGRVLIGVVSWGSTCGSQTYPGVYNRTVVYRDWIGSYAATLSGPTTVPFAKVKRKKTKTKTVTITNSSSLPASVASIGVTGTGYSRVGGTCGASLPNDSTCTVIVKFRPTKKGAKTGYLKLISTEGVTYTSVKLTGTGI